MTKTRLPPTWIVLLPALALAAVGVRAVMAEMRASQDAARDRARSVASRLARSVDALVDEYAAPLPNAGTKVDTYEAMKALSHLEPNESFNTLFDLPRTLLIESPPRRDGVATRIEVSAVPSRVALESDKEYANGVALVRDALATAKRLADAPQGSIASAALLDGASKAVGDRLKWPLRTWQARYELANGDRKAALDAVEMGWNASDHFLNVVAFDQTPYPEAALVVAAECVGRSEPPDWLLDAYRFCENRAALSAESELDRVDELAPVVAARMRPVRRLAAVARRMAREYPTGHIATARMTTDGNRPCISVWRSIEDPQTYWVLLGGEIPQSVVEDRIGKEVAALAAEPGVTTIRLASSSGEHAFDTPGKDKDAKDLVVETVPLADSLANWRAEAVVAPESGVPTTAWLLASAVVVMTGALLWGAVALRRAAERSARLAEDRRTFLDHVAHELRTPAAAVQALSEELASGHVAAEKQPEYRRHLLRESRRLAGLVDDTLDFARLDAGRLAFKTAPADLRDVVRQAVEESDGAGRVVAKLPDEPVVRDVDAAALRRAVKNLVENAVRHGGGDAPVDVALEAGNGHASIVVADHGRGIAPEHLPRIFERFWRAPSATHETKGVGLGLALCREIARAHGGDVEVASEVGKGSTFTLRVPTA